MIVFTCITGGYDSLKPIRVKNTEWRYVCITDDLSIDPKGWELVDISLLKPPAGLSPVRLQRWCKVIGGVKFFECDTIYLDGSHEIIEDVTGLWDGSMILKRHPTRNCYKTEAQVCIKLNKADHNTINEQVLVLSAQGLPEEYGMYETGILIRPFNKHVELFCRLWWSWIDQFTHRDQLSITMALCQTKIDFKTIDQNEFRKYITIHKHAK